MWHHLGRFLLKNRLAVLMALLLATIFMGYHATRVKIGYEFSRSIPTDNPKYKDYMGFKQQFGEDGAVLVIGLEKSDFFEKKHFEVYKQMLAKLKNVDGVEAILSVPTAINLVKKDSSEKMVATPFFSDSLLTQLQIDEAKLNFERIIFYQKLLYNPSTKAYLAGVTIKKGILQTKKRTTVINQIVSLVNEYETAAGQTAHISGLPLIRTQIADRVKSEMGLFLVGSLLLATIVLILFFRSVSTTLLSLGVVLIGVVFNVGTIHLLGYEISLLSALTPPLMIVIGIPNCIYFINKYHASWQQLVVKQGSVGADEKIILPKQIKHEALLAMVGKMGVVTLFCNIAAAVGFGVFALTNSDLLKEFGLVAGINIMMLFVISFILIPTVLSYLPPPKPRHLKYLHNKLLEKLLLKTQHIVVYKKRWVYGITLAVLMVSIVGIFRVKSVGFIVDDLPKKDKIYVDLKWFEKNFGGVMPLEIVVDTKKKNGVTGSLATLQKMDELSNYIATMPQFARPLSLVEGLKFLKQSYYDGDTTQYTLPNEFDMAFMAPYLKFKTATTENSFTKLLKTFMDSSRQKARISISMADVGTIVLPRLLDSIETKANQIFDDTTNYQLKFTGGSVTYLEGSSFIINGLIDSFKWAFLIIAVCMLYLFKSIRILICSLIPNIIPLVVTAGLMGWVGVSLKPSTVLVFSVALGIAIDITIRFLVNFKQELSSHNQQVRTTTQATIKHTGISIIYTSLVLVAGFVIFCFSSFGGTIALGWLTSFTLFIATITNLIFLPVLLTDIFKK